MNWAPLFPGLAWGLLALAIPLAVHLWNRKRGKVIKIGSVQLLSHAESARASRIQLHDVPLWLLRSLLVGLLVLLMMEWQRPTPPAAGQVVWHLADPAVTEPALRQRWDSLAAAGETVRWWSPGFPPYAREAAPTGPPAPKGTLLQRLSTQPQPPDSVVAYGTFREQDFPHALGRLPFAMAWQPVLPREATPQLLMAWAFGTDSLRLWWATAEEQRVLLTTQTLTTEAGTGPGGAPLRWEVPTGRVLAATDTVRAVPAPHWQVYLPDEAEHRAERTALAEALTFTAEYLGVPLTLTEAPAAEGWAVAWSAADTTPAAHRLRVMPEGAAADWWGRGDTAGEMHLYRRPLAQQVAAEQWGRLPVALARLLLPAEPPHHGFLNPETLAFTQAPALRQARTPQSASPWLWYLLLGLLVIERWVAARQKA